MRLANFSTSTPVLVFIPAYFILIRVCIDQQQATGNRQQATGNILKMTIVSTTTKILVSMVVVAALVATRFSSIKVRIRMEDFHCGSSR
jgi:hypothetical protein